MSDLTEFLLARIAEDETVAREAEPGPWVVGTTTEPIWAPGRGEHWGETVFTREGVYPRKVTVRGTHVSSKSENPRMVADMARGYTRSRHEPTAEHIARWDPTRVLAECEAKREMLALADPYDFADDGGTGMSEHAEKIHRLLALPYADHPDYRSEWAP